MYVIIEIYIFVCIMLLLFNLFFILTRNSRMRRLNPLKNKAKDRLALEFERYTPQAGLSANAIEFLEHDINRTRNLLIVETEMDKARPHREAMKAEIKPYVFQQMDHYAKKEKTAKAYYAYMLTRFSYENKPSDNDYSNVLTFLDSDCFYVFSNTMDAIYAFKDPYILVAAIKKVDERDGYYHSKLLTDGLLSFDCCLSTLRSLILKEFYDYQPSTQVSLLNYFRLKDIDVAAFALEILEERKVNEEVIYAAMRYFVRHPDEESKVIFMNVLKNEESFWVEQLLAIQGLKHYDELPIRRVIKTKVTSKNWDIRSNAISYLHQYGLNWDEISEVLTFKDKFTSERLYYYYEEDEEIAPRILRNIEEINGERTALVE